MKIRPLLGIAATLGAVLLPTAAYSDDASDLRQTILEGCTLMAWQFSVRIEKGGTVIPQLSPTLPADQKKCALQMVDDFRHTQAGAVPPRN